MHLIIEIKLAIEKMKVSEEVKILEFPQLQLFLAPCLLVQYSLLLERKVMTHLDSILRSRDITLPTKVHLVKAMFFPVVMYGCESWTIKLSAIELMLLNCGVGEDS